MAPLLELPVPVVIGVQEVDERADVAVGQLSARRRVGANRHGAGPGRAIDRLRSGAAEIDALQHLIEQSGFAAGANRIECVEELPVAVQRVDLIEIERAPELGSLGPDVADFDRRVPGHLALDFQIPVLSVRGHAVIGADRQRSVRGRNDERRTWWAFPRGMESAASMSKATCTRMACRSRRCRRTDRLIPGTVPIVLSTLMKFAQRAADS